MKYDKSLTEVWKEECYHELKDLSAKQRTEKIRKNADKLLSEANLKLRKITLEEHSKSVSHE